MSASSPAPAPSHPVAKLLAELSHEAAPLQPGLFGDQGPVVLVAYGGGVDSTAMVIEMVEAGLQIDKILFADTGSEKPATYEFLATFDAWLGERGLGIVRVRYEPKDFKNYPPYRTLDENCFTNGTLPSISFGFSSCSQKWKIEPQNRWTAKWGPAVALWAGRGKVIKLIGYDCSPADARRYAQREGQQDDHYVFGYPLRALGWRREDCVARIRAAGLDPPPKSACFMCAATKPDEIRALPAHQLRRIVLMEARAAPRLQKIEGLWRNGVKGTRGAVRRPGRITDFIRERGLLPAAEIDEIIRLAPQALVRWQDTQAPLHIEDRDELGRWLALFDLRDRAAFDPSAEFLSAGGPENLGPNEPREC